MLTPCLKHKKIDWSHRIQVVGSYECLSKCTFFVYIAYLISNIIYTRNVNLLRHSFMGAIFLGHLIGPLPNLFSSQIWCIIKELKYYSLVLPYDINREEILYNYSNNIKVLTYFCVVVSVALRVRLKRR